MTIRCILTFWWKLFHGCKLLEKHIWNFAQLRNISKVIFLLAFSGHFLSKKDRKAHWWSVLMILQLFFFFFLVVCPLNWSSRRTIDPSPPPLPRSSSMQTNRLYERLQASEKTVASARRKCKAGLHPSLPVFPFDLRGNRDEPPRWLFSLKFGKAVNGWCVDRPLPSTGGRARGVCVCVCGWRGFSDSSGTVVTGGCCLSCERVTAHQLTKPKPLRSPAPVSRSLLAARLFLLKPTNSEYCLIVDFNRHFL